MASRSRKARKENIVYAASRALIESQKRTTRKVGALTRLFSFFRESKAARKDMKGKSWWSNEKRRQRYTAIFADTCSPVYNAWMELWETAYGFLSRFFRDLRDLLIDIANIFIVIFYVIQSIFIWIGDRIADIAYWCEGNKRFLLSSFVILTILGVGSALFLTSVTAYDYYYYGTYLGTTKSKKLVYDTINVLGDKLAQNSGANVNINVERDI